MKTINKIILDNFNIGFEFEFYVKKSSIYKELNSINDEKLKKIPKQILKEYGHFFMAKNKIKELTIKDAGEYFKNEMNKNFPNEIWKNLFKVVKDASIKEVKSDIAIEVIYKHQTGIDAFRHLKQILTLLKSNNFVTTKSCGLHINVSFKDKLKNNPNFAFDLSKNLDIESIQKRFDREKNSYCQINNKTDLESFEEVYSEIFRKFLLSGKANTLENTLNGLKELNKEKNITKFTSMVETSLKKYCISEWIDERPAVAPKKSSTGTYIEFRAIGNKDYQHKEEAILDSLDSLLKAMITTDKIYSKEKMKI